MSLMPERMSDCQNSHFKIPDYYLGMWGLGVRLSTAYMQSHAVCAVSAVFVWSRQFLFRPLPITKFLTE